MSFEVIKDVEKGVAALIDAEFGRALGPIASGENAAELLEKFAGAHGVDPATIPTGELEARWKDFVSALVTDVEDAAGEVHKVADEVLGDGHAQAGAAAAPSPVDPPDPTRDVPPAAPAAPAAEAPAEAPAATEPAPAGERVMPVTSPKEGFAICPTCDGWGEVANPEGGVGSCPTCHGLGEVPAHEEPAADKPAA